MADLNHFVEQQSDFGADQEVAAVLGSRCLGQFNILKFYFFQLYLFCLFTCDVYNYTCLLF